MNQLSINVHTATGETIRKIRHVAVTSRALHDALADFDGDVKSVLRTYLALNMHKDDAAPGGLKTYRMIVADLGDVCSTTTVRRWLREIDPELAADLAAAHPCTR